MVTAIIFCIVTLRFFFQRFDLALGFFHLALNLSFRLFHFGLCFTGVADRGNAQEATSATPEPNSDFISDFIRPPLMNDVVLASYQECIISHLGVSRGGTLRRTFA